MPKRTYWRDPDTPDMSPEEIKNIFIKIRVFGMRYEDLIREFQVRGIKTIPSELSTIFHGKRQGPKVTKMLRIMMELVEEREGEEA